MTYLWRLVIWVDARIAPTVNRVMTRLFGEPR